MSARLNGEAISVRRLIRVIERLPSDKPVVDPRKWYLTQKQHWLGWLKEYHTPGAYGRQTGLRRDARYAYNHIVEPKMLLWLLPAAGVSPSQVRAAKRVAAAATSMPAASAAIRKQVPWEVVQAALWPAPLVVRSVPQFVQAIQGLLADSPVVRKGIWYRTQKEHWLGWLNEYDTVGAYGRKARQNHDARFAYNHIVNPQMLLWLMTAAGVEPARIRASRAAAAKARSMPAQVGAIRRLVSWETVEERLWPAKRV